MNNEDKWPVGTYSVIRTQSAGVFAGMVVARQGKEVILWDARRIWRWEGAWTVSEIAMSGLDQTKSKVATPVDRVLLTEVIEIIPCSASGEASIRGAKWSA